MSAKNATPKTETGRNKSEPNGSRKRDDEDRKTDVIVPGEVGKGPYRGQTPGTEVVQARTPDPVTSIRLARERTVDNVANPHTPSRVNKYHNRNSPSNSVGGIRGIIVPWSREVNHGRTDLPRDFPRQRLAPLSHGNETLVTRTITREFDFYAPPVWEKRNKLRDMYPYDPPPDVHNRHYPYFSIPPDDWRFRGNYTEPVLPPHRRRIYPEGKWSIASNKGSRNIPQPRTKMATDPGKVQTALWIQQHADPGRPGVWPYRIRHDRDLQRDYLESPLGKRRYIGHVPRVTDRDRWDRQYDDYLLYNDVDGDYRARGPRRDCYNSDPSFETTAQWIRKNHGDRPDYTDHRDWFEREKEILRQGERERYYKTKRDHLITRGSIIAIEGSDLAPDWHMTENERLRYLRDHDLARWRALKQRRHRYEDDDDFTSVSQRARKNDDLRRGVWTPVNAPDELPSYDYKPNWQVNDNWKYKRPRRNPKYNNVSEWLDYR